MVWCKECKKEARTVERDFGIGSYEFWGATGVDSNVLEVTECCDGDWVYEASELEEEHD